MDSLLQEKLLDLIVNIIAIVLGGGLVMLFIEWRRHQREMQLWKREDEMLQIDIPRSEMRVTTWKIYDDIHDKEKLVIYENNLEGTVKQLLLVTEFVIRNTTAAEIIITSYNADMLQIPSGEDNKHFYDLETLDLISVEDIGAIRLQPYATVPRSGVIVSEFGKDRKLEDVPTTLVIEAETSSGKVIQGKSTLKIVPRFSDIALHNGIYHPKRYVDKIRSPEDEMPF